MLIIKMYSCLADAGAYAMILQRFNSTALKWQVLTDLSTVEYLFKKHLNK
jgi:hypothetical protein